MSSGYGKTIGHAVHLQSCGRNRFIRHVECADATSKIRKALKPGANVIAATSFKQYFKGEEGDIEVYLEGLQSLPKAN